jgi:hypothetical protein
VSERVFSGLKHRDHRAHRGEPRAWRGTLPRMARRRLRARVNWAVRWGGAAILAGIALVYVVTPFLGVDLRYDGASVKLAATLYRGGLAFRITNSRIPIGGTGSVKLYTFSRQMMDQVDLTWAKALRFRYERPWGLPARTDELDVPLWALAPPVALLVAPALRAYYRSKRPPTACPSCNYDLSGLPPGSPCPECAAKPPNH